MLGRAFQDEVQGVDLACDILELPRRALAGTIDAPRNLRERKKVTDTEPEAHFEGNIGIEK